MLEDHLEKLGYFHAVANEGSILAASKTVGLSQSALTKSIQTLESVLNKKLFIRHRRGIELTDSGKVLYHYCERLKHEIPDLEQRIKVTNEVSGSIKIGTYETLGVSFWPNALASLSKILPNVKIIMTTSSSRNIWTQLDEGTVDLVVDAEPPLLERYYSVILYKDSFALYAKPKFDDQTKPIPFSFVKRAYDEKGWTIENNLSKLNINYQLAFDFDSFVSVDAIIKQGLAIGVLPKTFANSGVRSKKLRPYPSLRSHIQFGSHRVCATCLEDRRKDSRITSIFKVLKDTIKP